MPFTAVSASNRDSATAIDAITLTHSHFQATFLCFVVHPFWYIRYACIGIEMVLFIHELLQPKRWTSPSYIYTSSWVRELASSGHARRHQDRNHACMHAVMRGQRERCTQRWSRRTAQSGRRCAGCHCSTAKTALPAEGLSSECCFVRPDRLPCTSIHASHTQCVCSFHSARATVLYAGPSSTALK